MTSVNPRGIFGEVTLTPDKGCKCCGTGDQRLAWWHRVTVRLSPYERGVYGHVWFEGYGFTTRSARRDAWRRVVRKP